MTQTADAPTSLAELPGGPYDLEFFFDPLCPFAWQTSVWIRRVAELRGLTVGWRFISLLYINEDKAMSPERVASQQRSLRYHRVCAAARERCGNDAVGALYRAYGERHWYAAAVPGDEIDPADLVEAVGLPADLAAEADNEVWDALIRAESDEAFRRTGDDVGTPIITYDPPDGASLFGPVISTVPDDDVTVLALFDALRTFTDYPGFSELKRTRRPPLDLPRLRP